MDLVMPGEFKTRDDIKAGFAFINARLAELSQIGNGADPSEMQDLQRKLGEVTAAQKALDEKVSTLRLPTHNEEEMSRRVAGLAFPFVPDDEFSHVTREQWNLINYRSDELAFASSASRFHAGLGMRTAYSIDRQRYDEFDRTVSRLQSLNDALYVLDTILSGTPGYLAKGDTRRQRMQSLKTWKEYERVFDSLQRTGLSTGTAASGGAWLPTFFSAQLYDLVQLQLGVAALFPTVDMPGKVYTSPVVKSDGTAYYVPEQLTSTVGAGTAITESNAQTTNMTLTAWKIAARMWTTSEATEDLIIPVIPFILSQLAKVIARADDNIPINADDSAHHLDYARNTTAPVGPQDTDATNQLKVPTKGIRALSLLYGWNAATNGVPTGSAANPIDLSGLLLTTIINARARLGSLGRSASELPLLCNMNGYAALFGVLDKTSGTPVLLTVDKYGPQAAVLTGEVARLGGHPVVLTEFFPGYLDGTTGKQTEAGTKTGVAMPNINAFVRGIRRGVTIARSSERHIEYDQQVFVATARRDFQPIYDKTLVAGAIIFNNI